MPSFTSTLKKELVSIKAVAITLAVACLYICLSVLLLNNKLFIDLFASHTPLFTIATLFVSLIGGLWTSLSLSDFILTILTALLVGTNIMLLMQTVSMLENKGKIHLSIGGATIFSLIATGCTSCGLSLISVLGLSASLGFLPFHGMELHVGAVILLFVSIIYMLRQLHLSVYCKLPTTQTASHG
ncbi:MAG: hypothetical protein KGJ07_05255 [Patescibacteria group bacterium]|nr:hypothetical protein [Patescibacteria group bacterium]MDE2590757.1 hypothetical protein [Patescibacteria group bacterium]